MTGTSPISSVISSTEQQIADRAATFEKVASSIPDRVGDTVENLMATEKTAVNGPYPVPAPEDELEVSQSMVGKSVASIFNIAAELLQEPAMELSDSERGELAELWEEPVNRLIKKYLGQTENGDLWLAAGCTFMVLASKSERIRAIVSRITVSGGSITSSDSASPTAVKPSALN